MFDVERFTEDCLEANAEVDAHKAVLALVERTCSDPAAVIAGLGEPSRAGVTRLYHSDELTILNLVWGPQMTLMPHDHRMWAVIGIYTGREDNIFWRRQPGRDDGFLKAQGARSLGSRDTVPLGKDVIHSVTNPLAAPDRGAARLRRGLLRGRAQRVGPGDPHRGPLRRREEHAADRGVERASGRLRAGGADVDGRATRPTARGETSMLRHCVGRIGVA